MPFQQASQTSEWIDESMAESMDLQLIAAKMGLSSSGMAGCGDY